MKRDAAVHPSSRLAPLPRGSTQRGMNHHASAAGAGFRRNGYLCWALGISDRKESPDRLDRQVCKRRSHFRPRTDIQWAGLAEGGHGADNRSRR